ncbi:hypothetical protein PINS_up022184 [Pythium insidiosum]|nr:hypothetical protein PINS_up022184 [Pythium insidiosum]
MAPNFKMMAATLALAFLSKHVPRQGERRCTRTRKTSALGQEGERDEKITVAEHDMRMCLKEIPAICHWYCHHDLHPCEVGTVTQPVNVAQSPIVKVTLLGQRAWGELRRPWRDPSAMGKQWNTWNDTIQSALTGEPVVRQGKKAAKKAAAAGKRKSK